MRELGSRRRHGEILGAVGVIATLGYLAIQMRQNTDAIRGTSELGLSQQSAEWMSRIAAQPELLRIYDAAADDPDSLSGDDISRFRWLIAELFMTYEGYFHLYERGHITESSWTGKDRVMQGFLQNPLLVEWWLERITPFSDEFYDHIEQRRRSFDGSWTHQSVSSRSEPAA